MFTTTRQTLGLEFYFRFSQFEPLVNLIVVQVIEQINFILSFMVVLLVNNLDNAVFGSNIFVEVL